MTPAARTQAAIDLLESLAATGGPVDRTLSGYFRQRRYAGSKDRKAIAERVYGVLRCRARLDWRYGAGGEARSLVAAHLHHADKLAVDEIAALFDGSAYGPAPLSAVEAARLDTPADAAVEPDWVVGNYPAWLDDELTRSLGADKLTEMAVCNERAPLDLRVNTLRTTRDKVLAALRADGFEAVAGVWSPWAVRLPTGTRVDRHRLFTAGHIEVQDEASQLVALLCAATPNQQVIDFCAGAGGKTLALAAAMQNRGQVHALDTDAARLRRLKPRLDRAGVRNVQMRPLTGPDDEWLQQNAGQADRVLVDAPCSGSGTWRRNPDACWRLSSDELAGYTEVQRKILDAAATLVKPGGRLIYATCSMLRCENEEQADAFQARHDVFSPLLVSEVWRDVLPGDTPGDGRCLRLSPAGQGTDGFFLAIFERQATV